MNDNCFDALSNGHRRSLLVDLLEENPQRVAEHLPTSDREQQLRAAAYHAHLPRLEDYGFIRWDRATAEIEKGPKFDEIRPLLEFLDDPVKNW